jgi:hypothetical protein
VHLSDHYLGLILKPSEEISPIEDVLRRVAELISREHVGSELAVDSTRVSAFHANRGRAGNRQDHKTEEETQEQAQAPWISWSEYLTAIFCQELG